jgi:hypothetical protein
MKRFAATGYTALLLALAFASTAGAQGTAKKELVQRILQAQQTEIDNVSRGLVERPAAQMMQEAGLAMQRQVAPERREAMGKAIEAEVKKYVDDAYPLVRDRALKLAPSTIGAALEEKMSEDELRQLATWLESPANKKYQQIGPDMRNAFVQKLLVDVRPAVDPKVQALDARIRVVLGVPPAAPAGATPPAASGAAAPLPGAPVLRQMGPGAKPPASGPKAATK